MEKTNTVLDREPISSEYINSRQDFNKVVSGYKALKPPFWKSAWFYGTAGLATIAIVTSVVLYNPDSSIDGEKRSLKATTTVISEPTKKEVSSKKNYIAQVTPVANDEQRPENRREVNESSIKPPPVIIEEVEEIPEEIEVPEEPVEEEVIQEETVERKITNMLPNIHGVFYGEIPYFHLCDSRGIQVNNDLAIVEFKIQFYVGRQSIEKTIKGNRIPSDLCEELIRNSMGNEVFFTDIKAEHRVTGRSTHLNSMSLIPVQ